MGFFNQLFEDIVDLVYPKQCMACGNLLESKNLFCLECHILASTTDHFNLVQNDLMGRLNGRMDILHGAAIFNYVKEGVVQSAVHKLKYSGRFDIGLEFGKVFGTKYSESPLFTTADIIVPIPLHVRRFKRRGYNQAEVFARGISQVTKIPVVNNVLIKKKNLISQTKKSKESRFKEVHSSFYLENGDILKRKTILLVDDVLTTGATLDAAVEVLVKIPEIKIQLGLIALANN